MKKLLCNKRILAVVLTACIMATIGAPVLRYTGLIQFTVADVAVDAVPANTAGMKVAVFPYGATSYYGRIDIENKVPIYAIQQANGYSANYMKLRDIAHYLDFDVAWNESEPNAMRIYTNRHYLDTWTEPGPAAETKLATVSSMDIYINDVKVNTGVVPMMIENNNYFKVRDIAQLVGFWCDYKYYAYGNASYGQVSLDARYVYVDEASVAAGAVKSEQYARTINYESHVWYDESCGSVSDVPVTYTARDPWGNYDYTKLYFGKTDPVMNTIAQLILDRDIIEQDHSGVVQFGDGNTLNKYYRYPLVECTKSGTIDKASPKAKMYYGGSNFGANLYVRGVGGGMGVLSIEYNKDYHESRVLTQKTAAQILKNMESYSCDVEKINYLAFVTSQKLIYISTGKVSDVPAGCRERKGLDENTPLYDFPVLGSQKEISSIWSDGKIYVGSCSAYSAAFENLLNAAGYYYVANTTSDYNHINDMVWVPDEGRWVLVDCSGVVPIVSSAITRLENGIWERYSQNEEQLNSFCENNTFVLDLFYMLEDLKPGGWLSSDPTQNP